MDENKTNSVPQGNGKPNKNLKTCKACGAEIAKSAKACPNCGAKQKKHTVLKVIGIILILIIAVSAFSGSGGDSNGAKDSDATPTPVVTRDEIAASATTASYKDLMRTPEDYEGQYIVLTVKVQQTVKDGQFRVYTDDGNGWYMADEYYMLDKRVDDDTKILDDDVIKVYGQYEGAEEVVRALTGTKDEVPVIDILYIDLISE